MQTKRQFSSNILTASVLFGIYFGAGNLIFPIGLGQQAGSAMVPAFLGFLITAVGLIFLGTLSLSLSREKGLKGMGDRVSPWFGTFITMALSLIIGPVFAVPRTGSVSFEISLGALVPNESIPLYQLLFTGIFFLLVLLFSIKPNKLLFWVGKVLNPLFLTFLSVLILAVFIRPMGDFTQVTVDPLYQNQPFFSGFLAGYQTMDALGVFLFGYVAVQTLEQLGVNDTKEKAIGLFKSGLFTVILMTIIYFALTYMGATSASLLGKHENGAHALAFIAKHYFGSFGHILLSLIITFACLKTAVGLINTCSKTFVTLFPKGPKYVHYVIGFTFISFLISNIGLNQIVKWAEPVLMFFYPVNIALILLGLLSPLIPYERRFYQITMLFVAVAGFGDFLNTLPLSIRSSPIITGFLSIYKKLPLFSAGLGWLLPMLIGFAVGFLWYLFSPKKASFPTTKHK